MSPNSRSSGCSPPRTTEPPSGGFLRFRATSFGSFLRVVGRALTSADPVYVRIPTAKSNPDGPTAAMVLPLRDTDAPPHNGAIVPRYRGIVRP